LPSARERAWTPGCFPVRPPGLRRARALSWAWAPLQGFQPVAPADPFPDRLLPWSSFPYGDAREQVRLTRVCLTRHLPASGFRPSRRLAPCWRSRSEDRSRPWGSPFRACPFDQPHPFPGRCPPAVSGPPCLLL